MSALGDGLEKTLEAVALYENTLSMLSVLAVEYEAKTITAERFSHRVCELLETMYRQIKETEK